MQAFLVCLLIIFVVILVELVWKRLSACKHKGTLEVVFVDLQDSCTIYECSKCGKVLWLPREEDVHV